MRRLDRVAWAGLAVSIVENRLQGSRILRLEKVFKSPGRQHNPGPRHGRSPAGGARCGRESDSDRLRRRAESDSGVPVLARVRLVPAERTRHRRAVAPDGRAAPNSSRVFVTRRVGGIPGPERLDDSRLCRGARYSQGVPNGYTHHDSGREIGGDIEGLDGRVRREHAAGGCGLFRGSSARFDGALRCLGHMY